MNADRAARRAKRDAEWARRDAEDKQRARLDARIDAAAAAAAAPSVLPGGVGAALAAVLEAMKPFRAADGYMAFRAVGRSSDEVVALAEAVLAVPADAARADTRQARKSLRYCEGCTHEADSWHDEEDGHCLVEGCRCDVLELPGHTVDCDARYSNTACTCGQTITPGGGSVSSADTGQASDENGAA